MLVAKMTSEKKKHFSNSYKFHVIRKGTYLKRMNTPLALVNFMHNQY